MTRSFWPHLGLLALALLAAWSLIPASSEAVQPTWMVSSASAPAFLQQGSVTPLAPGGSGTSRSHLPSSVLPHNDRQCSVDTTDNPANCSVRPVAAAQSCSAACDSGQRCSAFSSPTVAGGAATCSVLGRNRSICSALVSPAIATPDLTQCSAFNDNPNQSITCSVMAEAKKQFCSAENRAVNPQRNQCSTFTTNQSRAQCSVLRGGPNARNFCSTVRPGDKLCSAFSAFTECSVAQGNKAICTNLLGASTGSCSVSSLPSNCSVIGGAPGTFCRLP